MKSILKTATVLVAFGIAGLASCTAEKDPCETVVCQNGGQTQQVGDSCKCVCDAGYEGTNCETEARAKFQGSWTANESRVGGTASAPFQVSIAPSSSGLMAISIGNFSDVFVNAVVANVSGSAFTISSQEPDGDDFFVITGTGTLNAAGTSIAISYTVEDRTSTPVGSYSYTGTWTK